MKQIERKKGREVEKRKLLVVASRYSNMKLGYKDRYTGIQNDKQLPVESQKDTEKNNRTEEKVSVILSVFVLFG